LVGCDGKNFLNGGVISLGTTSGSQWSQSCAITSMHEVNANFHEFSLE